MDLKIRGFSFSDFIVLRTLEGPWVCLGLFGLLQIRLILQLFRMNGLNVMNLVIYATVRFF